MEERGRRDRLDFCDIGLVAVSLGILSMKIGPI
jgi:hypothetical protein